MNSPKLGFLSISLFACVSAVWADDSDWPQWRSDSGHTAASAAELAPELHLKWSLGYSPRRQAWDDPLNNDVMQYDRIFEPVVKDGRMFIPFNDADKVVAIDVESGEELWAFYTDGPVRFAPAAYQESVYFTSDDGHLYCVAANDGRLRWRFRGGPSERKIIGNRRVISAWPARGGPVVADDSVYFAASIWPFMGTFIYSLDAQSGRVQWVNDSTSAQYIKQPHSAPSFAGVAPQGTMSIVGDTLLVPGGRSVPAAFDRGTGKLLHFELNAGGKGNGGSFVIGKGNEFYLHTRGRGVRAFDLSSGTKTAFMVNEPVLGEQAVYAAEANGGIRAYDASKKVIWEMPDVDGTGDLIQAGTRLYAAGAGKLSAFQLSVENSPPTLAWQKSIPQDVCRLLAGDGRLFAVTLDGKILAFGAGQGTVGIRERQVVPLPLPDDSQSALARRIVDNVGTSQGTVLWFGVDDEVLLRAVLKVSNYQIIAVDPDEGKVDRLRRQLDGAGLYGERISVHRGTINSFEAPPYIARAVVVSGELSDVAKGERALERAYNSVRPYGGCLFAIDSGRTDENVRVLKGSGLESVAVSTAEGLAIARRVGALPGAADWTHQYGDIANTVKSNDSRVKLPLGLLWFGGSSNLDVLPRHSHGPPEQVIGGRLYIEGMNSLSCRDVYTGSVIWKREFDLHTFDVYYDATYKDTPLSTSYNQVHIPGANGRGTNYIATQDVVYLAIDNRCVVLDAESGKTIRTITLPKASDGRTVEWGFIGVYGDVLLGGHGFANYRDRYNLETPEDARLRNNSKGFGSKSLDRSASQSLVAFDRHTGKVLWQVDAKHSFLHNGIIAGDGKVFCLDKLQQPVEDKLKRRGQSPPETYRILAIRADNGEVVWDKRGDIFGTWLSYSDQYKLLLLAGARASDRLKSEVGTGMAVYHAGDGALKWQDLQRDYSGPCVLHNDTILTNANSYQLSSGAFSLLDGTPKMILNPITREPQPWKICRAYGCNSIIASENLLTFRSGAAGYYDMKTMSGTGNLGGFKSGCTSNLVVANGVLNAPDYTRTCSCGYQNQTSLALVHMPDMDMWTVNHTARLTKPGSRVERIGVNFGAPGDRVDSRGTLWLEYPTVGGESLPLDIRVEGQPSYFHHHTLGFQGPATPWVGASGVQDIKAITIPLKVQAPGDDGFAFPVLHAADDAEESPNGDVNLTSSDLELIQDNSDQTVGIRFDKITLPRGTKIDEAFIQFTCDETSTVKTDLLVEIEDTGHAARFANSSNDVSSRDRSDVLARWQPSSWEKIGQSGEAERTPNIAPLIQHVIDRNDWKPGNALALIVTGNGKRVARSFAENGQGAPRLIVRASDVVPPVNSTPAEFYTVRLYFSEPSDAQAGERVFDVVLNGKVVERSFDIVRTAGKPRSTIVREYDNIPLTTSMKLELRPRTGTPIVCGVEIVRRQDKRAVEN